MSAEPATDYEGRPVPPDETPDTVIKVWEVYPHPYKPGYALLERSYQKMLAFVGANLVTFKVREMTLAEYQEAVSDEC